MEDIDFVIPWVDNNDSDWIESKNKSLNIVTTNEQKAMIADKAFRDWDILKYWFRSVEKFAPWVRNIHFVTYGHLPNWLDTNNNKLKIVNHDDYMDSNFLPTFNSRAIEINFHKIPNLANKFVYFNDDMFLNNYVSKEDFFKFDLPVDSGILSPIVPLEYGTANIQVNNMEIINKYFSFENMKKMNFGKYINLKYGKENLRSLFLMSSSNFCGFFEPHLPNPFLKSTFEKIWSLEEEILTNTSMSKIKNKYNVNQWLFRYWQLAEGTFYPRKNSFGKYYELSDINHEIIDKELREMKYKILCINDSFEITDFYSVKAKLIKSFEMKFPEKSSFEKY